MAATAEQNWRLDTAATGATRERRESAQKGGSRGGTEKDRGGREGGHDELFYAAGAPLLHRRLRYRKLRALTALRPHVRMRITAPCSRRTSGLISRRHAGLRRPPPDAPWHTTASSAQYKLSKRDW